VSRRQLQHSTRRPHGALPAPWDLGSEIFIHFGVEAPPVRGQDVQAAVGEDALEATSEQVRRQGSLFTARVSCESRAREGDPLELAVQSSRLHFFETETGNAI